MPSALSWIGLQDISGKKSCNFFVWEASLRLRVILGYRVACQRKAGVEKAGQEHLGLLGFLVLAYSCRFRRPYSSAVATPTILNIFHVQHPTAGTWIRVFRIQTSYMDFNFWKGMDHTIRAGNQGQYSHKLNCYLHSQKSLCYSFKLWIYVTRNHIACEEVELRREKYHAEKNCVQEYP